MYEDVEIEHPFSPNAAKERQIWAIGALLGTPICLLVAVPATLGSMASKAICRRPLDTSRAQAARQGLLEGLELTVLPAALAGDLAVSFCRKARSK